MKNAITIVVLFIALTACAVGQRSPAAHTASPHSATTGTPCLFDFERGEVPDCIREDSNGTMFVAPQHLGQLSFDSYGLAPLLSLNNGRKSSADGWMYVNRKGNVLITGVPRFENGPDTFHDGLVRFISNKKYGFASREGKVVIPPIYDGAMYFSDGVAEVCIGCELHCASSVDCEHHSFGGGDSFFINAKGQRIELKELSPTKRPNGRTHEIPDECDLVAPRAELKRSVEAVTRRFIAGIESKDDKTVLELIRSEGQGLGFANLGQQFAPHETLSSDFAAKKGYYCRFFDTECWRGIENRGLWAAEESMRGNEYSYREWPSRSRRIQLEIRIVPTAHCQATVRVFSAQRCSALPHFPTAMDWNWIYQEGDWKLLSSGYTFVDFWSCSRRRQATNAKRPRTVKLPRYMTDIPQPIPDELKLSDAPKTSRDIACFRSFDSKNSMLDVVRKCGIPDEHQGSGLYIFIYHMSDGSVVAVGTGDLKTLGYIDHATKRGGEHLLR